MELSHNKGPHKDIKHISGRLQGEVDLILSGVDEKTLFAEFRKEEIFDIQNGDRREVVSETLDERIFTRTNYPKRTRLESVERTFKANAKVGKVRKLIQYLFKPLE